jgi:dTDP-4-dehydrorhamnose 3,5-epimerase
MKATKIALPGVLLIEPDVFGDDRGFFLESYQQSRYRELGIEETFVQDNCSRSERGVLRGLHYQIEHPQGKLVFVTRGEVFDVVVDIRHGSLTFGQWFGVILSDRNHHQLYVPPGFAHGFCVLSEIADFSYKCTDYYASQDEGTIIWNDPDIGIKWPMDGIKLSPKDSKAPLLASIPPHRLQPSHGKR